MMTQDSFPVVGWEAAALPADHTSSEGFVRRISE